MGLENFSSVFFGNKIKRKELIKFMQTITSKDNEQIKHIRKLKEKKYRNQCREYIIEGIKLVKEAIAERMNIKTIVICDGCDAESNFDQKLLYEIAKLNCLAVPEKIFKELTDVENPQGILAVIERKEVKQEIDYEQDIIVLLDNIQDPGNLGTILRTVDSVGINQILVSKGTTDAFSSKVIRSSMGAIFRLNIIECKNLVETIEQIKEKNYKVIATSLESKKSIYDISYQKSAIIIGNEANGVEKEVLDQVDITTKIPMLGKTESLNASVATGIVLYEYVRQKLQKN